MKENFKKRRKSIAIIALLLVLGGIVNHFSTYNLIQAQAVFPIFNQDESANDPFVMQVKFKNVESQKIKDSFKQVWKQYEKLHEYEITLVQQNVDSSTMQAQPVITLRSLFTGIKRYRINISTHIRGDKSLKLASLSESVLTGWFAHEMGHVMDYQQYSNLEMVWYGAKYYFSNKFKRIVEHDADYIAIANGFHREIAVTKKFILEHNSISLDYKNRIKRYYLPEEDVLMCSKDKELLEPYMNL